MAGKNAVSFIFRLKFKSEKWSFEAWMQWGWIRKRRGELIVIIIIIIKRK